MTLITSKRWIVNRPAFFLLDMVFSHWLAVPSSEASRMHSLPPSCWFQAIPSVCQNMAYEAVNWDNHLWLVVLTILKNISQWKGLSDYPIYYGKWKNVWNHQPGYNMLYMVFSLSRRCFLSLPLDSLRLLDCRGLLSLKVIISTAITKKNKTSTMILIIINKDNHTTHIPRISNVPNVTSIGNMFPPI